MTQTPSTLGLTAAAAPPEVEIDPAILRSEFNEIMRASEAGFDYQGDPADAQAKAAHDEAVRKKIARGIELSAILRRQNTGPAKAKTPTGRARKGSKPAIDTAAAMAELLK